MRVHSYAAICMRVSAHAVSVCARTRMHTITRIRWTYNDEYEPVRPAAQLTANIYEQTDCVKGIRAFRVEFHQDVPLSKEHRLFYFNI